MQNAPIRRPERESVIESARILVLELNCPSGPTIFCFVDAKIRWVAGSSNGHQVSNAGAEGLLIAELQFFGTRYYTGGPCLSAVGGDGERPSATGCPDDLRVHWPHRDQTVSRAAVLRSQCGLMKMSWREFLGAEDSAGENRNKKSSERSFQHGNSSKRSLLEAA